MDYQAENSALQTLFNRMNSRKTEQAQTLDYANKAGLDIPKNKADEPLPAPTQPNPIHSDYLDQKRREEQEHERVEKQRRESIRKQLEAERSQMNHEKQQAASSETIPSTQSKHNSERQNSSVNVAVPVNKPTKQNQSTVSSGQNAEKASALPKEVGTKVSESQKNPTTSTAKSQNKFDAHAAASHKTEKTSKETAKLTDVQLQRPVDSAAVETDKEKKSAVPSDSHSAASKETNTTHVDNSDIRATLGAIFGKKTKPVSQQDSNSPSKENPSRLDKNSGKGKEEKTSIAVRPNGMRMAPVGTSEKKLSVTEIIPMKTDNGSIYDSAVKPSNAFRANVFLDCSYNEKKHEGCYGLVVDMGSKKMIQGTSGQTSDEWEYGFLGVIHAIRICRENNVKEVMFIIRDPLCEIIQQNTEGLIWGYSLTRKEFYNEFQRSKGEFASGFYSGDLNNDGLQQFRDLAETISRTLIFPPQEEQ